MNNYIKETYKPYRFTIKGKCLIINTTSGSFVIKHEDKDIKKLFNYLKSRGFYNYPRINDGPRPDEIVYEYLEDNYLPNEQKGLDLANLVSVLHHKTTFYKEVTQDKYNNIYENIKSNIEYLDAYYHNEYQRMFKEVYHSPSHYLFVINYSKIKKSLDFCGRELESWYQLVKDKTSQRVALVHNNLSLNHYIKNDNEYLISWEKYKIDTPVLDLVKFYQNNYLDLSFDSILAKYLGNYPWQEDEKKLFNILKALPPKIEFDKLTEFKQTQVIREKLDYIFKTEKLIRPDNSAKEEK